MQIESSGKCVVVATTTARAEKYNTRVVVVIVVVVVEECKHEQLGIYCITQTQVHNT